MEKRQATEFLEYLLRDRNIEGTIYEDALNIAIESLKAQLSQEGTTSDLISRQAAIDALNKQIQQCCKALGSLSLSDVDKHAVEVKMASLRAYRKMLENLPTIEPEPQEGHWIPHEGIDGDIQYECSLCGVLWEFNDGTPEDNEAYFCPKCGKKLITK